MHTHLADSLLFFKASLAGRIQIVPQINGTGWTGFILLFCQISEDEPQAVQATALQAG